MSAFPKEPVSLRRGDGGRAVLEAECGFGLAIVPGHGVVHRMAAFEYRDIVNGAGVLLERRVSGGGDSVRRVACFELWHTGSGLKLLPEGWFFTDIGAARDALRRIGRDWPEMFLTRDLNQLMPLSGVVKELCRESGVVAGRWHDLGAVRFDEEAWAAGAEARRAAIEAMPLPRVDARKMEGRM